MEERNYWSRHAAARRVSRRRVLVFGGGTAFLVACGGGNNSSSKATTNSAATKAAAAASQPAASAAAATGAQSATAASAKQPKPGGSLSFHIPSPPPSLDPYTQTSYLCSGMNSMTYSKLFRFRAGTPDVEPADPSMEPDLAQALPEVTDPTTITVKLKPGIKWQNVAPTNGRDLTSEDVQYAIDRYKNFDKSVHKSLWLFLDSMQTPDKQTITFKLKFPYADFVAIAGGNLASYISPKEHAETDAAATKMVGSGPFIHSEYQTGVSLSYKKNPDYYDKPYPYLDDVKCFITTDTAKRVADFSSKSVDATWLFLPDDRDQLLKQRPDAKHDFTNGPAGYVYLRTDKAPFSDVRVRQALSMAIDRKAIRDAITKGEGVEDQAMYVALSGITRPVKELGDSAKYWNHDPQAAKQLMTAAGVSNLSFQWSHADASVYTQAYVDTSSLTQAQWKKDLGVSVQDIQQPYSQYISTTYQGNFEGVGHSPRAIPYWLDFVTDAYYWGSGGRARINLSYINDQQLNALIDKQRGQFDLNERKKTLAQIEDIMAAQQYQIFWSTDTRTYFWAPDVQNYRPTAWFPYTHLMKAWRGT
ncbi:MAG TPA: ABC transporter substrate-binding protein [Dehalococcoidia bacterium]|nr:ABC transporter substrate-binding protein [Dehalococcoidia bacterium]